MRLSATMFYEHSGVFYYTVRLGKTHSRVAAGVSEICTVKYVLFIRNIDKENTEF